MHSFYNKIVSDHDDFSPMESMVKTDVEVVATNTSTLTVLQVIRFCVKKLTAAAVLLWKPMTSTTRKHPVTPFTCLQNIVTH